MTVSSGQDTLLKWHKTFAVAYQWIYMGVSEQ
jgi:hypothetical protein